VARRKFGNIKAGGFDSGKEAKRYGDLLLLRVARNPSERVVRIERQVKFVVLPAQLDINGKLLERAVHYIADFVVTYGDGHTEVEDVKSPPTRKLPAYIIKRKLMLFRHGIRIKEI